MGTAVHCKSYLPGYYSMRNLNEDCNSSRWPLFYGDTTLTNGQYYNGFMPRTVTDAYPGYDKDALKQKMIEHEEIFREQVYQLHSLYRKQRDMMEEIKRKEMHKHRISIETSSSSNLLASQMPPEDAQKWHAPSIPLTNSGYAKPSTSGAEIIGSPLSCTKGNSTQASCVPSQNGCASRDCEVLESRPSKVRKKLFDLQLPADEYIDTEEGEQFRDNRLSDILTHPSNANHKIAPVSNVKLFLGVGGKTDCQIDASTFDSCLRSHVGLADLNEPIQAEEAAVPASVDFLGHSACHVESRGMDLSAKPKSLFLGLPKEIVQNSQHGSNNGTLTNQSIENKGNGREWLSYIHEAGHSKSNLNSIPQGLQPDKLPITSHPKQVLLNKAHQPPGILPTDHSRDLWRERTGRVLEISDRGRDLSNYNCPEPVVASNTPSPYPFVNSSDLANSWTHSVSSWGKPSSSLTQKLTSVHIHPWLNSSATLSRSTQTSAQSLEVLGEKQHANGNSRSNPGLGNDPPTRNGFYNRSLLGSSEPAVRFPSTGFDYHNCKRIDNLSDEISINHGSEKFSQRSNFMDLNSAKDMNLNVVLPKGSSNEAVPQHGLEIIDERRKCEDHLAALPWLRAKPACNNEATDNRRDLNMVDLGFFQASSNQLMCKTETVMGPNQIFTQNVTPASNDHDVGAKEIGDCLGNRKILGFPIFENPCTSRNESSSIVSTFVSHCCPPEVEDIKNEGKNEVIDINLACDPESGKQIAAKPLVVEKVMEAKVTSCRNHFDLNSFMSEDEDPLAPSVPSASSCVRIVVEIDLEAPVVLEAEEDILPWEENKQDEATLKSPEHKVEHPQDEVVRIAAEAIVAISSSGQQSLVEDTTCNLAEASVADSLLWFVEVVSSCMTDLECEFGKELKGRDGVDVEESSSDEIDYFEAMTLQLAETKEEDYMPKPLVPDIRKVEDTGATSLPNRPRKGQARRGRQRRDFQRDILPGLASLSRHEVTEDLQTFGGLMRATGHPWHSGLTRRNGTRNGAGRGRRRSMVDPAPPVVGTTVCTPLVQQLNNIEMGLEDRSLTGWGKTTRRPRRQRCPPGNPPSVPLT